MADYQANKERRDWFFSLAAGKATPRIKEQRYRLTYTLRFHPGDVSSARGFLFIPYPIPGHYQPSVELIDCTPVTLERYFARSGGFFYGVAIEEGDLGCREYRYTSQVTVLARHLRETGRVMLSEEERSRWIDVEPHLAKLSLWTTLQMDLGLSTDLSDFEIARRIYRHLATTKHFAKTKESCQCLVCSTRHVLCRPVAHCTTIARTFIALCRLKGIPAREITGALAGYPVGGGYISRALCEPIFGHTWAEIFLEEYGWIPVEFNTIAIGANALTEANVSDRHKQWITEEGGYYLDYYFGNLDCARVTCSNSVKKIPQIQLEGDPNRGGHVPQYETWLELEIL